MLLKTFLLAGAIAIGAASLPGAGAGAGTMHAEPTHAAPAARWVQPIQQNLLSAREVIEILRSRFGGEPMGAPSLEQSGQRPFYVVRWRFPNEVVQVVRVDATSGSVF